MADMWYVLILHMRAIQAKFFMTKREHGCHQKQASKKFDDGASNLYTGGF